MAQESVDNLFLLTELMDQLEDSDPAVQIKAAKRLAALRDPAAIEALAKLYRSSSNKNVTRAASDALVAFRRLEREQQGIKSDNKALKLVQRLLTVILIISVVANLGLLAYRYLPPLFSGSETTTTAQARPREDYWKEFGDRLTAMQTNALKFRKVGADIPSNYSFSQKLNCESLDADSVVAVAQIPDFDKTTYPDIEPVNASINDAVTKYIDVRDYYLQVCAPGDVDGFKRKVDELAGTGKDQNYLVTQADILINQYINPAQGLLKRIMDNPAPTVGPTVTPTPTITDTPPPSNTPEPTSTPAPTDTPVPTNTPGGPTETPTPEPIQSSATPAPTDQPTETPLPTVTPTLEPTIGFDPNTLIKLDRRSYTFRIVIEGITNTNQEFSAGGTINTTYQTEPFAAKYDVRFSQRNNGWKEAAAFAPELAALGTGTSNTIVALNGNLYVSDPNAGTCRVAPLGDPSQNPVLQAVTSIDTVTQTFFKDASPLVRDPSRAMPPTDLKLIRQSGDLVLYQAMAKFDTDDGFQVERAVEIIYDAKQQLINKALWRLTSTPPASFKSTTFTLAEIEYNLTGIGDTVNSTNITIPPGCPRS